MEFCDLTIGIPTFNRCNSLVKQVEQILPFLNCGYLKLFIIDDFSSDKTASHFESNINQNLKFVRNINNKGYALNFLNLLRETETEYLIMSSDDDIFSIDDIDMIRKFIDQNKPDFICTKWFNNEINGGYLHRGKCEISAIPLQNVWGSSSHAPGLIYRVEKFKTFLPFLEKLIFDKETIALIYPQVLCVTWLLATGGSGFYIDATVISGVDEFASGIKDEAGQNYWDFSSRIKQFPSYCFFLNEMENNFVVKHPRDLNYLRKMAGTSMFDLFQCSFRLEQPVFFNSFVQSACEYKFRFFIRLFKLPFNFIVKPGYYIKKLCKNVWF